MNENKKRTIGFIIVLLIFIMGLEIQRYVADRALRYGPHAFKLVRVTGYSSDKYGHKYIDYSFSYNNKVIRSSRRLENRFFNDDYLYVVFSTEDPANHKLFLDGIEENAFRASSDNSDTMAQMLAN